MKFDFATASPSERLANLWRKRNYTPMGEIDGRAFGLARVPNDRRDEQYALWTHFEGTSKLVDWVLCSEDAQTIIDTLTGKLEFETVDDVQLFGIRDDQREGTYYVIAQRGTRPSEEKRSSNFGSWSNVKFMAGPYTSEFVAKTFAPEVIEEYKAKRPDEDLDGWSFGLLRKTTGRPRSFLGTWFPDDD